MTASTADALFDDYERTDDSPPSYAESTYSYLNRAAEERWSRVRSLLNGWFAAYPDEHKDQLRKALTASDPGQHLGAWWELYTFTLYRQLGYEIEIHPDLDGVATRPDFRVTRDAESMYVECTVVSAADGPVTRNPGVEAAICDAINQVSDDNFMIGLKFTTEGKQQPRRRQIVTAIGNWLGGLDPDDILAKIAAARAAGELTALPEKSFQFHDWVLSCTAYPLDPGNRGQVSRLLGAVSSPGVFIIKNAEHIRDAVQDKGSHYGALGTLVRPLIVAVLSVNNMAQIRDAADALFGTTAISVPQDDPSAVEFFRKTDGYWRGPGSERGTRVSAVLFSHDVQPWSVASHLPVALINPWADKPIDGHPPFSMVTITDRGETVETPPQSTPQQVFGL
ncbi:hypothetical protein MB901379_00012 [Mycobacterium basiliense]|uniref:Uncharacterized protein n=1 Tax=Mycobacterium basiliense TaxID=2094119 RepID=A0A447G7N5_9MYCO|nr:hypothetical protein [Mycobacterium basiliense]VDM86495.1 hypothetical protein MB901379_00012 [Mycobacterium basiliense]